MILVGFNGTFFHMAPLSPRASDCQSMSGFRADVDEDYAWLQANTFAKHPDVFPEDKFGLSDFRWAIGVVLSRSFFIDGELRLTPLADFANHETSRDTLEPAGESTCEMLAN